MPIIKPLASVQTVAILLAASAIGISQAAADQVIPDDLIVQGSECVGLSCVNNEAFNFSTIRLKENNTRIDFVDDSVGNFPARDWRLEANSSAAAGANYLAIKDMGAVADGSEGGTALLTVTAGAPANSIFLSNNGNVGFGTAAPALDLSMRTSDTPAVRFEQDGAGGFTPQTWDVAGNEANFFVRDVTGGSRLPFRIRPGAPTSSIDIAASGNIGIGTASPVLKMHILSSFENIFRLQRTGAQKFDFAIDDSNRLRIKDDGFNTRLTIDQAGNIGIGTITPGVQLHTTGGVRFTGVANCSAGIESNAIGTLSCVASSRRLKNVVGALSPEVALANVMALKPQVGTYKETPEIPEHWLIAEDVAAVDPALAGLADGQPFTVKTQNVVADLIAVVQMQQKRIEALEQALAAR
jgi:hypothetical protein